MLPNVILLARRIPGLRIVIDHLPLDGDSPYLPEFRNLTNVYAKLSGPTQLASERDRVYGSFREDRVMYASNWPVCERIASIRQCCRASKATSKQSRRPRVTSSSTATAGALIDSPRYDRKGTHVSASSSFCGPFRGALPCAGSSVRPDNGGGPYSTDSVQPQAAFHRGEPAVQRLPRNAGSWRSPHHAGRAEVHGLPSIDQGRFTLNPATEAVSRFETGRSLGSRLPDSSVRFLQSQGSRGAWRHV